MARSLPSIAALQAFESVGRLGSIRRAAIELAFSHTVLSRHLQNLERAVGTRLLQTGPTGVALTQDGRRYHDRVSQALGLLAEATDELRPRGQSGELRIWCAAGLAARWLTQRLPAVTAALPGVDIVLTPADRPPDFTRREADLEISYGLRPAQAGTRQQALVLPRIFPIASPAFVVLNGPFHHAADLTSKSLLHEGSRQQWRDWFLASGLQEVPPLQGPRLAFAAIAIEAAVQGQGIALANTLLVADDLAQGRLVEVVPSAVTLAPYVLRIAAERWEEVAIRRLRQWLTAEMAGQAGSPA